MMVRWLACVCKIVADYCGWTKSCTTLKPWETILYWYLQADRIIPGFLRWCEMHFVHPQGSIGHDWVFTSTQGNQLAGIQGGTRDQGYGRIPPKCTLTKFDMGHGAKLESPHIGTRSLRMFAEVCLSQVPTVISTQAYGPDKKP